MFCQLTTETGRLCNLELEPQTVILEVCLILHINVFTNISHRNVFTDILCRNMFTDLLHRNIFTDIWHRNMFTGILHRKCVYRHIV